MSIFNSDLKPEVIISALKDVKNQIRFVGILGSGMYPLAKLLFKRGYSVSGSDDNTYTDSYTDEYGITVDRPKNELDPQVRLVVYSLAIDVENPEISYAILHGIPLISRAQLLGAVMSEYGTRISISGSHGKSTTTALIDYIFKTADIPHTTVSGAALSSGESLRDEGGDIFIAEACEYKDSFLRLCPTHQLITSVELDHTDYFVTESDICSSFKKAADKADFAILNCDDRNSRHIVDDIRSERGENPGAVFTYGRSDGAFYRLADVVHRGDVTEFSVLAKEREFRLTTSLIGDFNLLNITAAVAIADILCVESSAIEKAVMNFRPIERRLTQISVIDLAPVYYDYAHHPTEIGAVIKALKDRHGTLTVIFRPHTYSRTKSLWNDFITELSKADFTILLDIYPAREKAIDGVNSKALAKEIKKCIFSDSANAARLAISRRHGAIALLGAGDVDDVKRDLIEFGKTRDTNPKRR